MRVQFKNIPGAWLQFTRFGFDSNGLINEITSPTGGNYNIPRYSTYTLTTEDFNLYFSYLGPDEGFWERLEYKYCTDGSYRSQPIKTGTPTIEEEITEIIKPLPFDRYSLDLNTTQTNPESTNLS